MQPIYTFDVSELHRADFADAVAIRKAWDLTHLVAALQGIVNRDEPVLYLRINREIDDFWFSEMTAEGAWMDGRPEVAVNTVEELLEQFATAFTGFVVWDERVPATSNLASTIAGVEDRLPLRLDKDPNSLCRQLLTHGADFIALTDHGGGPLFTGEGTIPGTDLPSTGSPKNDAYRWLLEHYVKTGRVNAQRLGYYIDGFWLQCGGKTGWPVNHTLSNHDWVIAERGVFFDLNVWEDEAPVDEPEARPGLDLETLKLLLGAVYTATEGREMIHCAGYVPWRYKYTNVESNGWHAGSKHGAVPAEWKCTEIMTAWNVYLDADALEYASMANASFFRHYPLAEKAAETARPTEEKLREAGYLDAEGRVVPRNYYAHYVGDYDAAAWMYWNLPEFWHDPARGELPLSWAFNPNLCERFAFGYAWMRQNARGRDHFVAGDSGAGYVNARNLEAPRPHSGLPDAMGVWADHCARFMGQWDLRVVGFVLDGNCPNFSEKGWDAYARFASGGLVFQRMSPRQGVYNGMPWTVMVRDLTRGAASQAAREIKDALAVRTPRFLAFRSVLMSPTWYLEVEKELDAIDRGDAVLVDLETLLFLIHRHETSPS